MDFFLPVKTLDPSLGYINNPFPVINSKTSFPSFLFALFYFGFFFLHVKLLILTELICQSSQFIFLSFKAASYHSSRSLTDSNLLKQCTRHTVDQPGSSPQTLSTTFCCAVAPMQQKGLLRQVCGRVWPSIKWPQAVT